jgi:glycine cleavage system aminomethyltransferase T
MATGKRSLRHGSDLVPSRAGVSHGGGGDTRGSRKPGAVRTEFHRHAAQAGVRRRFAPHQTGWMPGVGRTYGPGSKSVELPAGPLFCVIDGPTRGRPCSAAADGQLVGVSSGRIYSLLYKEMISLCSLNTEYADLGTEVTVLWGDPGSRQMEIRATVSRFPFLDLERNENVA